MNQQVSNQCNRFGYYNEDFHEVADTYCKRNEGAFQELMDIDNAYAMKEWVYEKCLQWARNHGVNPTRGTFYDLWQNVRTPKATVQRREQENRRMQDIMRGRRPF